MTCFFFIDMDLFEPKECCHQFSLLTASTEFHLKASSISVEAFLYDHQHKIKNLLFLGRIYGINMITVHGFRGSGFRNCRDFRQTHNL